MHQQITLVVTFFRFFPSSSHLISSKRKLAPFPNDSPFTFCNCCFYKSHHQTIKKNTQIACRHTQTLRLFRSLLIFWQTLFHRIRLRIFQVNYGDCLLMLIILFARFGGTRICTGRDQVCDFYRTINEGNLECGFYKIITKDKEPQMLFSKITFSFNF